MSESKIMSGLNPEQEEAVRATEGAWLILAGAGSGKTRVITRRIGWLLHQGVSPSAIMAVTFTNKAAAEMRERVCAMVGPELVKEVTISTFHSFGLAILRQNAAKLGIENRRWTVMDEEDRSNLLRQIVAEAGGGQTLSLDELGDFLEKVKGRGQEPVTVARDFGPVSGKLLLRCFRAYQGRLEVTRRWDFDDLLWLARKLLMEHPAVAEKYARRFRYIMVDEYQDTNLLQLKLLMLLASVHHNICAVGDDDQSIYGWRGARVENILEFERHFPGAGVFKLTQNYRSSSSILGAANRLIANNHRRRDKALWTEQDAGVNVRHVQVQDPDEEARLICATVKNAVQGDRFRPGEVAVLYRTKGQAAVLEQSFALAGIPHRVVGSFDFFKRKEVRDCLAYFRLLVNRDDDAALGRVLNYPERGIRAGDLEKAAELCKAKKLPLLAALEVLARSGALSSRANAEVDRLGQAFRQIDAELAQTPRSGLEQLVWRWFDLCGFSRALSQEKESHLRSVSSLMYAVRQALASNQCADLGEVLERLALGSNDADFEEEGKNDVVSLITLHAAKGLEFDLVFIAGMVDGLIPHFHSTGNRSGLEEERRLLYVGLTRAKKELVLCSYGRRMVRGSAEDCKPSRFLPELALADAETPTGNTPPDNDGDEHSKRWKSLMKLVNC